MIKFLNSVGKTFVASSSSVTTSNKSKLIKEIDVYISLAQREYNSIINAENNSNVRLYKYAAYHIASSATSVASESAFSTASYLLRKQRSRLTPENLSYSMFLKDKLDDDFNI
ncbi:unnamed protein product [Rotaria sp. Silwood2]|nr:unnamed protein product [Rotaria sp. Silwood2]